MNWKDGSEPDETDGLCPDSLSWESLNYREPGRLQASAARESLASASPYQSADTKPEQPFAMNDAQQLAQRETSHGFGDFVAGSIPTSGTWNSSCFCERNSPGSTLPAEDNRLLKPEFDKNAFTNVTGTGNLSASMDAFQDHPSVTPNSLLNSFNAVEVYTERSSPKTIIGSCNIFVRLFVAPRMQPEDGKSVVVQLDGNADKSYLTRKAADDLRLPLFPLPAFRKPCLFTKFGMFLVSRFVRIDVDGWNTTAHASNSSPVSLHIALVEPPEHIDDGSIVFGSDAVKKLDSGNFALQTDMARQPHSSTCGMMSNTSMRTVSSRRGKHGGRRCGTRHRFALQQAATPNSGNARLLAPTTARHHFRRATASTDFRSQSDVFRFSHQSGSSAQTSAPPSVASAPVADLKVSGLSENAFMDYTDEDDFQVSEE